MYCCKPATKGLYNAVTDCGAGGFSSAVGEMGESIGAEVWLERAPLKYAGLSYTEIWISEAQERMVFAVPPAKLERMKAICAAEGVEASVIGQFVPTGMLRLMYEGQEVGSVSMEFLHDGRPPVVRDASYSPPPVINTKIPELITAGDTKGAAADSGIAECGQQALDHSPVRSRSASGQRHQALGGPCLQWAQRCRRRAAADGQSPWCGDQLWHESSLRRFGSLPYGCQRD